MKSRRNRRYRKIEMVDNKINLVDIKTNMANKKMDKWIKYYDSDMNTAAKMMIISITLGAFGAVGAILIGMILSFKGVI